MSVMAKTIRVLFLTVAVMVMGGVWADTWTDPDTGYTWTYYIYDTIAGVYSVSPATGPVTIPSSLDNKPVARIMSVCDIMPLVCL